MDRTVTPQGRRASTARGYLDQARGRPNLTIRTHALTDHIILPASARWASSGWRREHDPVKSDGQQRGAAVRRAIASPQILQRSGVGNPELLRQFDIPVVHDLPAW